LLQDVKYNSSMFELPLRIRPFKADDLEALYQIDQICFPGDIAFSRAELFSRLNHPKSIARVAEGLGRILGFVLAQSESLTCAHVLTLDVIPEVRQCNIGTLLMNVLHAELQNQGICAIVLEVGVLNVPAQQLYKKLEYQYLGILSGYYNGKEDAYRMVRVMSKQEKEIKG
jgi:ribosomal-protein-alanine N-acetyltransferase